ncbi:hypothetical protein [Variovorax sp. dw_308]|uniref:hypothetical protein n=1 Tax=Variovorax sp. dw_308 TaxID=2721546 RepID=UPI001C452916|nr:hypothetical protein [Variovorax sp. dw_308]
MGNLQVECQFNDVRSVCPAYLFLLKQGAAGEIYNDCSGSMHSLQEIISAFERITGRSIDVRVDPDLVRPSEVYQLCGDPRKVKDLMASVGLPRILPTLQETLESVLAGDRHNKY